MLVDGVEFDGYIIWGRSMHTYSFRKIFVMERALDFIIEMFRIFVLFFLLPGF